MKRALILFFCVSLIFSCKKETKVPPVPEPTKTGTATFNVATYDSLGNPESDLSGVRVSLYQTAFSGTTGANGKVTFYDVPYGDLIPFLVKDGYDGLPISVALNSPELSVNLPCTKYSAYKVISLTGHVMGKDSIYISFTLDRPVPAGKVCKIAVVYSKNSSIPSNFDTADSLLITSQHVQDINIAKLPNLRKALESLNKTESFYLNTIPVSYGICQSNLYGKQVLIGENLYPPSSLNLAKTW